MPQKRAAADGSDEDARGLSIRQALSALEGQPCRHPPFSALNRFLDENGYCITTVACKAADFRPGAGVEIEPEAHFRAIDTKVAFTIASLLLGIGQGDGHGSGNADLRRDGLQCGLVART
jgi:hypothetical protein